MSDIASKHADFSSGWIVSREVVHLWNVSQPQLAVGNGSTDCARHRVTLLLNAARGRALSETVSLHDVAAEADLQEVKHFSSDRRRPRYDKLQVAAEHLLDLVEDDGIVEPVGDSVPVPHVFDLGFDGLIDEPPLQSRSILQLRFNLAVYLVEQSRDSGEVRWLQDANVLGELQDIAAVEGHLDAVKHGHRDANLLKDVRQRQVGDIRVGLVAYSLPHELISEGTADSLSVRHLDSLWVARRSRGVAQ